MKFKNHLIERFFERYGKLLNQDDINRLNNLVKSAPQLRYTTIRCIDFIGMKVYVYVKQNRIATFLTEKQAFRTQDLDRQRKEKHLTIFDGKFNIGDIFKAC